MVSFPLLNMTASNYIETIKYLPIPVANAKLEEICGVQVFFGRHNEFVMPAPTDRNSIGGKEEYGDWQTNMDLALTVCRLLKDNGCKPKVIIEPTCGKGNFILAALQVFDSIEDIYGIEIHNPYIDELKIQLLQYYINNQNRRKARIHLYNQNFFDYDFTAIKQSIAEREVLVLGNPPWVNNSKLGSINSSNIPQKRNLNKLRGMDAITGKSNFDIAEYICKRLMDVLADQNATIALLLKNSVIKNIVYRQRFNTIPLGNIVQYTIDAKKEFNVSVAASLLCASICNADNLQCTVKDLYKRSDIHVFGWIGDKFVSDTQAYEQCEDIDGKSQLEWRSGVKHDCSTVMELTYTDDKYINGLGEIVDIEEDMIYPLLKSSDIKGGVLSRPRKYVIITQHSTSDDTKWIKTKYPKTYQYLLDHAEYFDNRGSRIYKDKPRFCIFGIGSYSFKPYKVVVSGLYKHPKFTIVTPADNKIVMVDDTCYMLGFDNLQEATITQQILNSQSTLSFINSLTFMDAKRVISKDILMRIDLIKALQHATTINVDDVYTLQYKEFLSKKESYKEQLLF